MKEQNTRVLAIDLGASSGRVMMARLEDGAVSLQEIHRFSNDPVPVGKTFYWDILRLFHEIRTGLQKAKTFGPFESLSVDTWGVDFGLLDRDGNLLSNPVHYRDDRTAGMCVQMEKMISPERLYEITGNQIMEINTLFQLLAVRQNQPDSIRSDVSMLMIPDLLHYMLTGKKAAELSIASTSQMLNMKKKTWSEELARLLDLPEEFLPRIVESGTVIGTLAEEICTEFSLPPVKVIASAGHDTQCAMAATPAEEKDFIFLSCGTWSLLGTELDEPLMTPEAQRLNITNECGYGGKISFLKNIIGLWLIQESRRQWKREGEELGFSELEELAQKEEPLRSLIDPDDPIFTPAGNIPERIREYCRNTGQPVPETKGQIVRCINESLALKYRKSMEEISQCTKKAYPVIYMVGGGTQSRLLCRLTADACGCRVLAGPVEATALGNALIQMITLGAVKDLKEARTILKHSQKIETYEPDLSRKSVWDQAYKFFAQHLLKQQ